MKLLEKYKFTDKKHTLVSIMSCILGLIAIVSILLAAFLPYLVKSVDIYKYGMVCALSVLMALAGIVLAVIGKYQKEALGFFPRLGLILNIAVLIVASAVIVLGV